MEASEKTLIYQEDADPVRKLMTNTYLNTTTGPEEGEYVDLNNLLDVKVGDMKTVKVTFTGEGGQLAIYKSSSVSNGSPSMNNASGEVEDSGKSADPATIDSKSINHQSSGDVRAESAASGSFETASSEAPDATDNFMDCPESPTTMPDPSAVPRSQTAPPNIDTETTCMDKELQYTDMNLGNKSDSEDDVTVVMSGDCTPNIAEDEFHYITTHEIQLSELDHDVDYEFESGSSWEIEDDHQVYSFVDYASFDSDETAGEDGALARLKGNQATGANRSLAAVSSLPESDPRETDKCAISDESLSKHQNGAGNAAGQIHLSIKATSRAINEPSNGQEKENILYHAAHTGDMSFFRSADTNSDKLAESAKCYIALPSRLHFGRKLKGKDAHDYSSGASSAVSELDDADKEVRNLTARAFKSLAYPYFDTINFSTSSESSLSEGINRWSTFVDLKYGNVNMTKGRHSNLMSHKSTSNFKLGQHQDSKGIAGMTLASMRAPPVEVFALNGNLVDPKNAASARKKIELMQKLGQGKGGVITLTETLNFHCNVQSEMSGSERRAKFAQNAAGSRSTDEVTNTLPSGQGRAASQQACNAGETMEGTHKKAIFASSLLKNVISKKMQFEQERKMERGEIREQFRGSSPCVSCYENENPKTEKTSRGLQRQGSRHSEGDSDYTIVCLDDLGDIVDSSSCDAKDDNRRDATLTLASETNLESTNEAGIDTKKGAFEASKSTLLRSQNSAFRSWRDGELEFQKEHKNDKTPEGKLPPPHDNLGETDLDGDSGKSKLTKMSHLFLPSIQVVSNEGELCKGLPNVNYSLGEGGGLGRRPSDNTLFVPDNARSVVTSKSPEIKISLRSVKDSKSDPFNIAKLLTPNIGCNAVNLIKTSDDSKCQALAAVLKGEPSDKVPHFTVRDIRDNKGKLQTPIHQVRDVRKLVKSSYHFVSLDNNESKSAVAGLDLNTEQKTFKQSPYRNPASLSPIVIKCQSVNTNSSVRQSGNLIEVSKRRLGEDIQELDRSSPQLPIEGARNGTTLVQRPTSRAYSVNTKQARGEPSDGTGGLNIETRTGMRRQEKASEAGEKKPENKMANQAALEKLQAAVKTMEQLYVFDRNEWKRRAEPLSQPLMDSHVLSLITSEEQGPAPATEDAGSAAVLAAMATAGSSADKPAPRDSYSNVDKSPAPAASAFSPFLAERNGHRTPTLLPGQRAVPTVTTSSAVRAPQTPSSMPPAAHTPKGFVPISAKLPVSLKISQARRASEERSSDADRSLGGTQSSTGESENYLTIPVKPQARPGVAVAASNSIGSSGGREKSVYTFTSSSAAPSGGAKPQRHASSPPAHLPHGVSRRHAQGSRQSPRRTAVVMETRSPDTPPTATIYHHSVPMATAQPQVICFSPSVQHAPVGMATVEAFGGHTQRKMLLDPTTGSYYLVDTPVASAATRRLFDPETGQYVDVPLPPAAPPPPQQVMTPVPLPMSPLALSPGAYGHHATLPYVFYPGFMPSPTLISARMPSQMTVQGGEVGLDERRSDRASVGQQGDGVYVESPYYVPTGARAGYGQQQGQQQGAGGGGKQPVISIMSQQGPRIIAPPSFDGTTMSFVVEHR
ncbi:uncharacterized protein C4orf54 homolog [Alosa sapidissima]|uniref:uncharacterized protein C4orf54 homolog n=1 Tax=Alosa sapidissima TaxID=34773 RepID=UPI001C0A0F68|nr:uncharacterized protein C4orf54 homolog [Alosa sapidissima]